MKLYFKKCKYFTGTCQYDAEIGRWSAIDPALQAASPYMAMGNNPMMYVDENGEFWHLVIGAAIGGIYNWLANGAQFNAKGLGYFGVGALAGALGAGVGSGVTAAFSGSTFGAGFVGSQSAMSAISSSYSSSFISGAAIGGASGFSGGLVSGFGNALVNDQNFGQALNAGVKSGLMGGISGAFMGGLTGGIDAMSDSRNFWSGNDQGMGRSLLAFNNSDKMPTHYRTNKGGYELIDNIEREGSQWVSTYDDRVRYGYGDSPISNGGISRRDNYLIPGDKDLNLSLGAFKGRVEVNLRGHILEGYSVQVSYDGNIVRTFTSGAKLDDMLIPASVHNLGIKYILPTNHVSGGTLSPWRTTIRGFKK